MLTFCTKYGNMSPNLNQERRPSMIFAASLLTALGAALCLSSYVNTHDVASAGLSLMFALMSLIFGMWGAAEIIAHKISSKLNSVPDTDKKGGG